MDVCDRPPLSHLLPPPTLTGPEQDPPRIPHIRGGACRGSPPSTASSPATSCSSQTALQHLCRQSRPQQGYAVRGQRCSRAQVPGRHAARRLWCVLDAGEGAGLTKIGGVGALLCGRLQQPRVCCTLCFYFGRLLGSKHVRSSMACLHPPIAADVYTHLHLPLQDSTLWAS